MNIKPLIIVCLLSGCAEFNIVDQCNRANPLPSDHVGIFGLLGASDTSQVDQARQKCIRDKKAALN